MRKTPLICSLLMAFGVSALVVGCEPSKPPSSTSPSASGGAVKGGSTTGKGAEVPGSPSGGSAEKPKK